MKVYKKYVVIIFFICTNFIYGEITVKILTPIKFTPINSTHIEKGRILGLGEIEISTNNKTDDIGKRIVFEFQDHIILSNGKKTVKTKNVGIYLGANFKENKRDMVLTKEIEIIKFYAILDKNDFLKNNDFENAEGEYTGYLPIAVSQYKKVGD